MYTISNLMRSLYNLTGISFFNSAANALYKVNHTTNQVKRVQNDANRAKSELDKARDKKAA